MGTKSLQDQFLAIWDAVEDDDPMAELERSNMLAHAVQTPELNELVDRIASLQHW